MLETMLSYIPKPVAMTVAALVIGGGGALGLETRYMTVTDFTKSYVLDLKREIRALKNDLDEAESDRERRVIQEQIETLLDELCEERPDDPLCKARTQVWPELN